MGKKNAANSWEAWAARLAQYATGEGFEGEDVSPVTAFAAFAALSQLLGSNAEKARRLRRLATAPPRRAGDWFAAPLRKFFDVVVAVPLSGRFVNTLEPPPLWSDAVKSVRAAQ